MGLVLDEPKDNDKTYAAGELKVIIDGDLLNQVGSVEVDYRDSVWRSGFSISAANDVRALSTGKCC